MSNQAVEIEILGKMTRVNCPPGQEESLLNAAADLNERLQKMSEKTNVANTEKLLTIAALNACYELQQRKTDEESQKQMTERMEKLSASLEDALKDLSHGQQ
ncbi:cell division protein ZapA [Vibrio sp. JC009]|uniref:cell division protein ZapA n=1 Tax=Vibrio sp. JC009 TaxID=2912314 RepID=UPI0023B153BA|nr:cell division protein ZapA [Vibrio sp. JC009]WED22229.1 cell division protein ZapA [Vibrio sp. JC009]